MKKIIKRNPSVRKRCRRCDGNALVGYVGAGHPSPRRLEPALDAVSTGKSSLLVNGKHGLEMQKSTH